MFKTVLRLLTYLKNHKKVFAISVILVIIASGLELLSPLIAKSSIDSVMTPAFTTGVVAWDTLFLLLAAYLGINLTSALLRYISVLHLRKMSNQLIKTMRDELFAHLHRLPISYFDQMPAGQIVSRITNDTEALRSNFYVSVLSNLLVNFIQIIGVYIAIFLLNYRLALGLLIIGPILYLWQHFYTKFASRYNIVIRETIAEISGQLNEFINGMPIIQAFQKEDKLLGEFKKKVGKWFQFGRKYLLLDALVAWGFGTFLRNLTILGVIYTLSRLFLGDNLALSVGLLYAFIDYINRLFDPIEGLIQIIANIQQSLAAGTRIFEFADQKEEEQQEKLLPVSLGAVEFSHVDFGYVEDQKVLHDVTFTAAAGQTLALVGQTGSGKSSILNLLFRFYDPQGGKILVDGQNIREFNRYSVRKEMAIVLQDPYLFTGTIATNIGMDDPTISKEMMIDALTQVGASYLLERYEDGLDHPVVEKGNEFSSGERQLISFARALVFDPKILILDEATSHVDTETEVVIQKAMAILKKGRTTFIIAHRLSTIKDAQKILVLNQGKIIEQGTHTSLISQQGSYYQMYQMQSQQL
ncbi:ABC transporter ATP-binding protein [Enterococcus timonensis]|uniref:ABC transporter ATP-binding protein n=1 Tax=Enterococcus timonensis TaxID=1852364 RepID=UPI0008DA30D5|nr:ABC transporter ATP-binding protein [Enterococcus timonensis]